MANGNIQSPTTIVNSGIQVERFSYTHSANLSAGAYGYYEIDIPDTIKNARKILSVSIALGHPGAAGGYQVSGSFRSGESKLYVSYYTPIVVAKANTDIVIIVTYIP